MLTFGLSDALGGAVSLLMAITTVLAALVALQWGYNPLAMLAVNGLFFAVDLIFFASSCAKLFEGGWFPLFLAALVAFLMLTWRRGGALLAQLHTQLRQPEDEFFVALRANPPIRVPGAAAVFGSITGIPLALAHHFKHNHVLHERILLVSTLTTNAPQVAPEQRAKVTAMDCGLTRVVLSFGFMEKPDVPAALFSACQDTLLRDVDASALTYFLRRETVVASDQPTGMVRRCKTLFATMLLNANRPASYYGLPLTQVVEIGLEVEI